MLTAGVSYIFGGKKFIPVSQIDEDAVNAEINRYRSELAQAQADLVQKYLHWWQEPNYCAKTV